MKIVIKFLVSKTLHRQSNAVGNQKCEYFFLDLNLRLNPRFQFVANSLMPQ